jgi:hypothetical protein
VDRNWPPEAGRHIGSFGFFECTNDRETATALIAAAAKWVRERGMQVMRGPVNPSYTYGSGVLVEGFEDPPAIGTSYNPPYYDRLLAGSGVHPIKDFLAYAITPEQLRNVKSLAGRFGLAPGGAKLRPYDVRHREREVQWIWELHSKGFAENYDFVPISVDEVRAIARDVERFGDFRFIQFCEVEGRPAGVVVALPDWNQALRPAGGRLFPLGWWKILRARRSINRIRIFLVCLGPEWKGTGLAGAFLALADPAEQTQYTRIEASWIVESHSTMVRALTLLGARPYKRYRMYERSVE